MDVLPLSSQISVFHKGPWRLDIRSKGLLFQGKVLWPAGVGET